MVNIQNVLDFLLTCDMVRNFSFQCGLELGETLLNITRAWEAADTSTSTTLVGKLPMLVASASANSKAGNSKTNPFDSDIKKRM